MNDRLHTGLVVGKFAPLHRGHVRLVEAARARCDEVVVVSYTNPEFAAFPPGLRRQWLQACFPGVRCLVVDPGNLPALFPRDRLAPRLPANDAPDEEHRAFVARLCVEVVGGRIDGVFTSEDYGDGFAASLERHFARAGLPGRVAHVAVDPARRDVPISGSLLREDLWAHWHFLPPPVARTLVRRIVLLGAESTGKTTLAERLARDWDTAFVAEYGRELWLERDGGLAFEDMAAIATEQVRREDTSARDARRYLFCDTSPLTTLFYSQALFGRVADVLADAARRPYDLTVLCAPDIPFEQDGTRQPPAFRDRQHAWYRTELAARGIDYVLAEGSMEERVARVGDRLSQLG